MPDTSLIRISRAVITPLTDENGRRLEGSGATAAAVDVAFNPENLQISATSSMKKRQGKSPPQVTGEPTVNLTLTVVFDSTTDGSDVREKSRRVLAFMDPPKGDKGPAKKNIPRILLFEWGSFRFTGYLETFKEDIDFFSPEGNPLRATVALTIIQQTPEFPINRDSGRGRGGVASGMDRGAAASLSPMSGSSGLEQLGDAATARRTAAYNGIENMRFPEKPAIFSPPSGEQMPPAVKGGK